VDPNSANLVSAPAPAAPPPPVDRGRLRPPRNRVSTRAIWYWTVRALPGWLILIGVQVIYLFFGDAMPAQLAGLAVTLLLALAHLIVMPQWRYRVHLWEATDAAVYTQAGWINVERRIAPVSRIQTVDTERGPFEQLFGLANVTVTTASAAGPLTINGLDRQVADRLVTDLTANTQATRGDAT
jgi:membrane protein YdbS with pleckstrin-like domain